MCHSTVIFCLFVTVCFPQGLGEHFLEEPQLAVAVQWWRAALEADEEVGGIILPVIMPVECSCSTRVFQFTSLSRLCPAGRKSSCGRVVWRSKGFTLFSDVSLFTRFSRDRLHVCVMRSRGRWRGQTRQTPHTHPHCLWVGTPTTQQVRTFNATVKPNLLHKA